MGWFFRFFSRWRRSAAAPATTSDAGWQAGRSALARLLDARQWRLGSVLHALVLLAPLALMLPYTLGWHDYETITRIDQRIYNQRLLWFDTRSEHDDRVVIVDIDENSLKQYGRWPWHRDVVGRLADELLQRQQVAVLGFDILFAEPDIKEGEAHAPASKRDMQLAAQLRGQPVVLGHWFSSSPNANRTGILPRALLRAALERWLLRGCRRLWALQPVCRI